MLDVFDEISVCTGYRLDGRKIRSLPASAARASRIEPILESLPGWSCDTTGMRHWGDLPEAARGYIDRLGEIIGTEVGVVGVGPDRSQSIIRPGSWVEGLLKD